jgi:glyoxylase-like metal-dependent hydrolase (beta-lactamase superfamily II)
VSQPLQWKLFIRKRASATQGVPPGKDDLKWVANTTTLIYGEQEALQVDTFLSNAQTAELADWIAATSRRLSTIYITHAHPDHFFGLKLLRDRFPSALVALDIGHTDTDHTTCLHVPSLGLVVAGDAIYNCTHPYLVESDGQGLNGWLAAIDKIEALNPQAVVVGHGPLDPDNSPRHIHETRRYIHDFIRLKDEAATAQELYDRMLALYPDRINPGSLSGSANAPRAAGQAKA